MLWFVIFIICNTMKRIGISFIVLLSIVSCSWIDTKTKEDIDNKVKDAKAEVVDANTKMTTLGATIYAHWTLNSSVISNLFFKTPFSYT